MTHGLYADLVLMGMTMLQWIQDCAPEDVRAKLSEPLPKMLERSEQSMLRILHYPAQDGVVVEEGAERAAAHEDINLITLLVAGSAPGLQAQDTRGNWHDVPCDPGMIAVNTGDMLELATGGVFPSTTHRVVNPETGGGARFSMPMFVHPRPGRRAVAGEDRGRLPHRAAARNRPRELIVGLRLASCGAGCGVMVRPLVKRVRARSKVTADAQIPETGDGYAEVFDGGPRAGGGGDGRGRAG